MRKKEKDSVQDKKPRKLGPELDFASAEAYNLLRTNVCFSMPAKKGGKIIGTTSPCAQEGKSFTTINLAYSLAEAGNKVILIDGDMRRPSVSSYLGKPVSPGLSNLLVENVLNLHQGILHPNLTVLTAGDTPPNPSELIGSERMRSVLESFSQKFDYVLVDLPPVTAVSDALAVSKYLDGIVVVVRHGRTRRSDISETIRRLRFVQVHILGFVYNAYSKSGGKYYKYHSDKYSRYYSSDYYKENKVSESSDS